jgi:CRISPR/Cas system CSM-associated protein Csm3 (group 7 of RAMP superfamily)
VATDCNGLPYIPGTALAGVLRHALESDLGKETVQQLMGFQGEKKEEGNDDGQGSRLILSHAQMVGHEGRPVDGLAEIAWDNDFYKPFQSLPVRQHVRISHKGAGEDKGKFDEQVVYKGTRFCFEMELVSDGNSNDTDAWMKMLELFQSPVFRIGGGTRKGFGELLVKACKTAILDLKNNPDNLKRYLKKTSKLNDSFWEHDVKDCNKSNNDSDGWIKYKLHLAPEDFFLFSSGLESDNAKMIPVTEKVISWKNPLKPTFTKEQILIPATSVKGALAHRVAFHYNKKKEIYADQLTEEQLKKEGFDMSIEIKEGQNRLFEIATKGNPAVRALFGYSAKGDDGQRGKVIFSDLIEGELTPESKKLFNHVAIDRFTGGAMDSALFNEEVVYGNGTSYTLNVQVDKKDLKDEYIKVFEAALDDLKNGMLPLGGGTMRGHGRFTGTITKKERS